MIPPRPLPPFGGILAEFWNHLSVFRNYHAATHRELLNDWPSDQEKPSPSALYEWLNRAFDEKRIRREGEGTRDDPWRYRLENEDDKYWDRGELPPLRDLWPRRG